MDNLWLKVENIVAKGEIARFEQFLLLSLCFQKGVRKRLYEGKGLSLFLHTDASAAGNIWRNMSKVDYNWFLWEVKCPCATMFSTLFNDYSFFSRDFFPIFAKMFSKSSIADFFACEKGLIDSAGLTHKESLKLSCLVKIV